MMKKFLFEALRVWPLLGVIVTTLLIIGDNAQLIVQLYDLSMVAMVVVVAHLVRKAMFPYVDLSRIVTRAENSGTGAGLIFLAVIMLLSVIILSSTGHAAEIPERAKKLLPVLAAAIERHWPDMPLREIPAGQIEQESSWKADAELKTSREHGRGLVQLTIAYRADGSERFNSYRDALRHYRDLKSWDWETDPYNVEYQLSYLVLQDRANYARVVNLGFFEPFQTWQAALVCYNAGPGRVLKRRAVALSQQVPVNRWDGGLASVHGADEERILYSRPLWQAVNEYPAKILARSAKYSHSLCHGITL